MSFKTDDVEEADKASVKLEFVSEYDENVNEFQSRYEHKEIRDLFNSGGDEDDASTNMS